LPVRTGLGRRGLAQRQFERVLVLRGADFRAHLYLGRLAFDDGDYTAWRREHEQARRLDPVRFARLRRPIDVQEPRLAGTQFEHGDHDQTAFDGTRATWRSLRPNGARPTPAGRPDVLGGIESLLPGFDSRTDSVTPRFVSRPADGGSPEADAAEASPASAPDDCSTTAERRRFLALGPIQRSELQHCDLDELVRRLSG
jgi:hypothetical protein